MVAFVCNRRHNCLQLLNALTMFSTGVSDRVNNYLNFIGLTSSRDTALQGFDTLQKKAEVKICRVMAQDHLIRPFICADNIDFQARVHHQRVEKSSRLFHGSWAYLHFIPSPLTPVSLRGSWSLESFLKSMRDGSSKRSSLKTFMFDKEESDHWVLVLKSQLASALVQYVVKTLIQDSGGSKPDIPTKPPPIDPIDLYKPDVLMLKMMDASDNSAEGVGQLIEQICGQISFTSEKFSDSLQVVEGDVGTCNNIESLRRKRHPAQSKSESLQNILSVPGAAHTLWNYGEWIFNMHYGDEQDSQDTGVWRTWEALGGKPGRQKGKKDFNTTMVMIHHVHHASLVYCLK